MQPPRVVVALFAAASATAVLGRIAPSGSGPVAAELASSRRTGQGLLARAEAAQPPRQAATEAGAPPGDTARSSGRAVVVRADMGGPIDQLEAESLLADMNVTCRHLRELGLAVE